jgi:hypothetical protein
MAMVPPFSARHLLRSGWSHHRVSSIQNGAAVVASALAERAGRTGQEGAGRMGNAGDNDQGNANDVGHR